ncbi:response regulator transcription factor [Flavisolibacter sp. BT320]|nr:response regulator transcription factor [Flavisolibacter longurius]
MADPTTRCVIIEDELPAAAVLEHHIARFPSLQLKGKFRSIHSAMPLIHSGEIDLIFLDINLPGTSGIEFANTANPLPAIIFTTAYPNYALEGFDVGAVDYLLKPISFDRFSKGIQKYLKQNQPATERLKTDEDRLFIFVKCDRLLVKLYLDEILYLEAQRNTVVIFTRTEVYKTYLSIAEMEEKLPSGLFLRVHRSYLVSCDKVERFSASAVTIQQTTIPIGRLFKSSVLERLKGPEAGW